MTRDDELRMRRAAVFTLFLSLALTGCGESVAFVGSANHRMSPTSGFFRETVRYNGQERKFVVFLPEGYSPQKKYPAILFLHGFGGAGRDGLQQVSTGLGKYLASHYQSFNFIVVFPQTPWTWESREDQDLAIAALDEVQTRYSADPSRITLSGISLGGYGAWMLAARYPNRFCSVVVMSGLAEERVAPKLTTLPVWCFHYETDPFVGCSNSQRMVQLINAAGGHAKLTTVPGIGHYVWDKVYGAELFDWMQRQHRPPTPESPLAQHSG